MCNPWVNVLRYIITQRFLNTYASECGLSSSHPLGSDEETDASGSGWYGRKARDDNGAQNLVAVGKNLGMKKRSVIQKLHHQIMIQLDSNP